MLIFCESISPRLEYTLDFIFKQILNVDYYITDDKTTFTETSKDKKICYAKYNLGGTHIITSGLLNENNISTISFESGNWNELPTIFQSKENEGDIPFDIFSAIFYLLSRYEEYLPSKLDKYQRFQSSNSVAFINDFLNRPIVNEWIETFAQKIDIHPKSKKSFKSVVTFDVDNTYSYRGKGIKRSILGLIRDFIQFNFRGILTRISALKNLKKRS